MPSEIEWKRRQMALEDARGYLTCSVVSMKESRVEALRWVSYVFDILYRLQCDLDQDEKEAQR